MKTVLIICIYCCVVFWKKILKGNVELFKASKDYSAEAMQQMPL